MHTIPGNHHYHHNQHHHPDHGQDYSDRPRRGGMGGYRGRREPARIYDGKRMRRHVERKFYDYANTVNLQIVNRTFRRSAHNDPPPHLPPFQPFSVLMTPGTEAQQLPASAITTHFAHASTNKERCPINVITWAPEGRRLITGASTGEFTLWSGYAFNFETIQQAHAFPVRGMVWSHDDAFMASADQGGMIKYWQPNMNNLKEFTAHTACIRELSFAPTSLKFSSCSDDGTVKIWDFETCHTEKELHGHGSEVKCCDWHPYSSLVASGAKDYLVKLWDAKSGENVVTLHGHKNSILKVKWNRNGNWLLTCSYDQTIKVFDIRHTMTEMQTFRGGHVEKVSTICWHPHQETLFASGGYDGGIAFWNVGNESPQAKLIQAHDSAVWDLKFHPLGHILASGSNDHSTKFWVRNRPGDSMRDKYNVSQIPIIGEQLSKDMYGIDINALLPYGVNSEGRDGRSRGGPRSVGSGRHMRSERPPYNGSGGDRPPRYPREEMHGSSDAFVERVQSAQHSHSHQTQQTHSTRPEDGGGDQHGGDRVQDHHHHRRRHPPSHSIPGFAPPTVDNLPPFPFPPPPGMPLPPGMPPPPGMPLPPPFIRHAPHQQQQQQPAAAPGIQPERDYPPPGHSPHQ